MRWTEKSEVRTRWQGPVCTKCKERLAVEDNDWEVWEAADASEGDVTVVPVPDASADRPEMDQSWRFIASKHTDSGPDSLVASVESPPPARCLFYYVH